MAKLNPRARPTKRTLAQANEVMKRRLIGIPYRTIATELGISTTRAHQLHEIALRESLRETTNDYVTLQEQRVELLLRRALSAEQTAAQDDDASGVAQLLNTALRATDQLNKIRGIYERTDAQEQQNAVTLLDTLVENSRRAAAQQTGQTENERDTETQS